MLSILKKTAALLLTLTITFSQCTISAAAETYDFSNQETVDMSYTDMSNTSVSDADFGNFRNVKAGRIGTFNLFRSQHPANGTSRSISANKLAKKNAISAVLNLSDSDKKLNTYFVKNKIASTYYYRTLYAKGNVHLANMKGQYNETVYRKQIVECMRFIIRKQGPYLVHCEIGRDRTGFVILLIESLMGASYTYMFKDYAQSYISRDGLTYEQARKKSIPLINEIMSRITGKPKNTGWGKLNLSYYAELYLKKGGMSPAELNLKFPKPPKMKILPTIPPTMKITIMKTGIAKTPMVKTEITKTLMARTGITKTLMARTEITKTLMAKTAIMIMEMMKTPIMTAREQDKADRHQSHITAVPVH